MGFFSGLINARGRAADKRIRRHLEFLEAMSARDRADIGLRTGDIEIVARQMAEK